MQIGFILSLIFAIIVALFAVLNSEPVSIRLFWQKYEFSQGIVILGSAALGAVIVLILGVFGNIRTKLKIHDLNNQIKGLTSENEDLKNQLSLIQGDKSVNIEGYEASLDNSNNSNLNQEHNLDQPIECNLNITYNEQCIFYYEYVILWLILYKKGKTHYL